MSKRLLIVVMIISFVFGFIAGRATYITPKAKVKAIFEAIEELDKQMSNYEKKWQR